MKYSVEKAMKEAEVIGLDQSWIEKLNELILSKSSASEQGTFLDELVTELFGDKFGSELAPPWKFFSSNIGKMVVTVMAEALASERVYSAKDVAEMKGCTVQTVSNNAEAWGGYKEVDRKTAPWKFLESELLERGILKKRP